MSLDIQRLLDTYYIWLKDKTAIRQIDQWTEITTPYLDRHNDYIQIYAKKSDTEIILTDDGGTLTDLEQSGCKLESPKRQDLLKMTLNGFGVQLDGKALQVHASKANFALRKHNLMQAILAVNDMFYLAAPMVSNIFYEDVAAWFDLLKIRYTTKVKFTGKMGYDHLFDFVIPKSPQQPERILQAINHPNRPSAEKFIFSWLDTKVIRPANSRAYAILNDQEEAVPSTILDALRNYDVQPVQWSLRDGVRLELSN